MAEMDFQKHFIFFTVSLFRWTIKFVVLKLGLLRLVGVVDDGNADNASASIF